MAEARVTPAQGCVSLEDVCLHFTEEEWGLLNASQKLLYQTVMLENFWRVLSLGLPLSEFLPGAPGTDATSGDSG